MKVKTRSILEELNAIAETRNTDAFVENRAVNVINGAINLMELIQKHYNAEEADELERRLINSIKGQDPSKFQRGIKKIAEGKQNKS